MISDFLVQHPSNLFFMLNEKEYEKAIQRYPQLQASSDIDYYDGSATALIQVGQDSYFDNETILEQFDKLFKLIQFKRNFKDHEIEIIVDNARTHTAKSHSFQNFGKNIGTRCSVENIKYTDSHGKKQILHCYFQSAQHQGLSKGLYQISKEFNFILSSKTTLANLRKALANHPAFKVVSSHSKQLENPSKIFYFYSPLDSSNWQNSITSEYFFAGNFILN